MADPKGSKLYVNLGASQARRRLKGFGHGVRKIQTAGRNQSVVIHTALGRHLEELKAQFADVGCSTSEGELTEPIENLPNLGSSSAVWLREVGIGTIAELERRGPIVAYRLVKQQQPSATLDLLYALSAGLSGKDAKTLSADDKERLQEALARE